MKLTTSRRNNFNLMWLILALLVIVSHSPELIDGNRHRELLTRLSGTISFGEFAVDAFFLLSGHLIMQSWALQPEVLLFLKKRVLRIYPGFIVASILCAVFVGPLGADPVLYFSEFDCWTFIKSVSLLQLPSVPPVFAGQPYPVVNGSLWTISLEFTCYLSVLILGASGLVRTRYAWLALSVATIAVFAAMKAIGSDVPPFLRLATFFCSGACFYLYREMIEMNGRFAFFFFGLLTIGMFSWRGAELALATAGAYVMIYLATKRSAFFSRYNRLPDISYGIYLYGWPVQKLLIWYIPAISPWILTASASLIVIILGYASWHLVEKQMLRFKGTRLALAAPLLTDPPP